MSKMDVHIKQIELGGIKEPAATDKSAKLDAEFDEIDAKIKRLNKEVALLESGIPPADIEKLRAGGNFRVTEVSEETKMMTTSLKVRIPQARNDVPAFEKSRYF